MSGAVNPLDIRTCITQVQSALVDAISLAFQYRYPEAQTVEDLRTAESKDLPDRALRFVVDEGCVYRLVYSSRLPQLLPYVVHPTDRDDVERGGRWIRQSSSVTLGPNYQRFVHRIRTGYAQAVQAFQGEDGEALDRIYARRPAFLVEWAGDTLELRGYQPGTIYEQDLDFDIICLSQNLRDEQEALYGSPYVGEIDPGQYSTQPRINDPGLYRLIGDVRYFLAGNQLGLGPGIKWCDIQGQAQIAEENLAQRVFAARVPIKVRASVHIVDEDLVSPIEIWIQRQDANAIANDGVIDPGNHVADGYRFSPQDGLTAAPSPGVAYINGALVTSAPGAWTFEPNADTYRDLFPTGQIFYQPVDNNAEAPVQPPGTLRLGFTVTDASSIIQDVLLCSFAVNSGANPTDPFKAA